MNKKLNHIVMKASVLSILIVLFSTMTFAQEITDNYRGIVVDKQSDEPKYFASISVEGTNIGTVTNSEGSFIIKVPVKLKDPKLVVSYIGYNNAVVPLNNLDKTKVNKIPIVAKSIQISEITTSPKEPESIVRAMFRNISEKYYADPAILEAFYRESVKERRDYQILAEAVVNIYKAPIHAVFGSDQVTIEKGRKKVNAGKIDTLLVKLRGGPRVLMYLDLIKNPSLILNHDYMKFYEYKLEEMAMVNNRAHYVVSFTQKGHVNFPLYNGKFYIDVEKLALKEAKFSMNMVNSIETQRRFIQKKPFGMIFKPLEANYHIRYEEVNNKWMFDYARAEVSFKCDYKRRLFKNRYTITSEMVITDRKFTGIEPFARHERFYASDILSEKINSFLDDDFWGNRNIIDPTTDINEAIEELLEVQ